MKSFPVCTCMYATSEQCVLLHKVTMQRHLFMTILFLAV